MDAVMIMIHDLGRDPVCVNKSLIRSQYVVAVVKHLKVLATCHELWVSGKPSNRSARGVDIPLPLVIWFFAHAPTCRSTFRTADGSTVM
jgi:hypothetical protein